MEHGENIQQSISKPQQTKTILSLFPLRADLKSFLIDQLENINLMQFGVYEVDLPPHKAIIKVQKLTSDERNREKNFSNS